MIKGLAHVALYTDKLEETISFYKNAFAAEEITRFQAASQGVWLKVGDSIIEVFESNPLSSLGCFKHIALNCDNVDETIKDVIAAGGTLMMEPKEITIVERLKIAFVKGINEEQIELCQNLD